MPRITTDSNRSRALASFTRVVQQCASEATGNVHAGCTSDEVHFIRKYYQSHASTSLVIAIKQCALTMLETYRASELPTVH